MIEPMIAAMVEQFPIVAGFAVAFGVLWQWLSDVQEQCDENQKRLDTYHDKLEACLQDKINEHKSS